MTLEQKNDEIKANNNEKQEVKINLSLPNEDEIVMSDFQKDFYKDELKELPPIRTGEVIIDGIYTYDQGDKLEVSVYIRNGLSKNISMDIVPLVITNSKGDILAEQMCNLRDVGVIPTLGGRPFKIYFEKENVFVDKISMEDWNINFKKQIKAVKSVVTQLEGLPENLPYEFIKELNEFIAELPLVKNGQVNISVFKQCKNRDDSISIILLIRNGAAKPIKVEKLPISIEDEQGELVAGGVFDIENIIVNAAKEMLYTFTLYKEKVINNEADISKCKVYIGK